MGKMINETFEFKTEKIRKRDGSEAKIAYIQSDQYDNTFEHKDQLKNQFSALWDPQNKRWFWYLPTDQSKANDFIERYINPCVEFLVSREKVGGSARREPSKVKEEVAKLIADLDSVILAPLTTTKDSSGFMGEDDLKDRLKAFKEELINIVSDDAFKKMLEPIIKFKTSQGHSFSFINAILVYLQDPKATMVKSKNRWTPFNRKVIDGSPSIALWVPVGGKPLTKEEKEDITIIFLNSVGKKSVDTLSVGEKEQLQIALKPQSGAMSFKLVPIFYDKRYTTVFAGKKDLVPPEPPQIEWSDETSEPTELTKKMYDATLKAIGEFGIQLNLVDQIRGGAKGVSQSGSIVALKTVTKNAGDVSTLVHELSHELLHQNYLKKNSESWAEYFVGKANGRAVVEQQAELSAWIVMKLNGFNMPTSINYMGIWGLDEKKAATVFDTVARVATLINQKINNALNESIYNMISEVTGLDVAKLLGAGAVELYNNSKEEETVQETKIQEEKNKFFELFDRFGKIQ